MENNIKHAFQKSVLETPAGLGDHIWHTIEIRIARGAKIKLFIFSVTGVASLVAFVPMWKSLLTDFSQSGLYEYLSLAFGSGSALSSSWKELSFSIAESVPTTSIIFALFFIFTFFLSVRFAMKQVITNQLIASV